MRSLLEDKDTGKSNVQQLINSYPEEKLTRILAQKEGKDSRILIKIEDASHFYAKGRDCFVVVSGEELKVKYSLKEIEEKLSGQSFCEVS